MLTRREVLLAAAAAGRSSRSIPAGHARELRHPGAMHCDCHTHIVAARTGSFLARPARTHGNGPSQEMSALHGALGLERVVIVTPSVYGTDNSATLYGMKARGAQPPAASP